jgi:hypothetical protein
VAFYNTSLFGCSNIRLPGCETCDDPGIYSRHLFRFSSHEFGKEYDTLAISLLNATANEYTITRRWRYEKTDSTPNYQLITSAGIYYPDDKVLEDMESGDLLTFDPKQSCLFIGTIKYQKL